MFKSAVADYPVYFQKYIDCVPDEHDLITNFSIQRPVIIDYLNTITEEKAMFSYAPGKWTLKEMLQHIIDTERIFSYRALCFARRETISLPGFDEANYAANVAANDRNWNGLIQEFSIVRQSTEMLFESFSEEVLTRTGIANNNVTSVASIGYITLGHVYHHKNIMAERYLIPIGI